MKLQVVFMLFLIAACNAAAQNVSELEKRNGFKDIKLGMLIDSVKGATFKKDFKERDEFDAKLYEIEHDDLSKIGEVKVKKVLVKAYKNKVYHIEVLTDKDARLMKALESIYGKADYDMKNETYFWKAPSVVLKFRSFNKSQLQLQYYSPIVMNEMKKDKAKKVDDIADDI